MREISLTLNDRNADIRQKLFYNRHLLRQVVWHALSVRVVVSVRLVAECRRTQVKSHRHAVGLYLSKLFEVDVHKARNGVGELTF